MAEKKGPIATQPPNRIAMSKALGAAFLHHQVEQLEKSVSNADNSWRHRDNTRKPSYTSDIPRSFATKPRSSPAPAPRSAPYKSDIGPKRDPPKPTKDADVVIVDASVLIHGIGHLKKWCKDTRKEVIIIPLEALNTLDLLKKGTSTLAQRARNASRILEAQVGTNPRIRVQRDDAFVPWDSITFNDTTTLSPLSSPEWVRRTICCARWEQQNAATSDKEKDRPHVPDTKESPPSASAAPRVVLAVFPSHPDSAADNGASPGATISPVPLPAPQPNRHEPRSLGTLVARWAANAGIEVLELSPLPGGYQGLGKDSNHIPNGARRSTEANRRSGDYGHGHGRKSPEDERAHSNRRSQTPSGANRGRRNSHLRSNDRGQSPSTGGGGLVERPPAVMAMMEMVAQPSRVVRVLARGEKLDP